MQRLKALLAFCRWFTVFFLLLSLGNLAVRIVSYIRSGQENLLAVITAITASTAYQVAMGLFFYVFFVGAEKYFAKRTIKW